MTKPYSSDFRTRAISLALEGKSRWAVAGLLKLSASTVVRWVDLHKTTGVSASKPTGGVRRMVLLSERDWLLSRIAEAPDLTIRAVRAELAARGTKVSKDAIWRFFRTERLSFKKNPARSRAGSPRRRPQAPALAAESASH